MITHNDIETNILIENLKINELQKNIIALIRKENTYKEICKILNISKCQYYYNIKKIKKTDIKELLNGR
jgi:DNA-directed RNA polymerase specialized sigma subunit